MQLPAELRDAIAGELAGCDGAQLRSAAARLSQIYRDRGDSENAADNAAPKTARLPTANAIAGPLDRAAYLAVRMPATFAAVSAALAWTREACGDSDIGTMLDLGSGPGTALWAAAQVFPGLIAATAIERDPALIATGRRLASHSSHPALREAQWLAGDLTAGLGSLAFGTSCLPTSAANAAAEGGAPVRMAGADAPGRWDLVVCSYALNELGEAQRAALLRRAWERCSRLLVIVEPGTRAGFANVLAARSQMLAWPGQMLASSQNASGPDETSAGAPDPASSLALAAPCPNALACPMAAGGDWCHFAARVERTATHRHAKQAELGFEDEKFSYIAFLRKHAHGRLLEDDDAEICQEERGAARIVRRPRIFSGYTQLTLCREGRVDAVTVTRSQKPDWRRLKRLGWGDAW